MTFTKWTITLVIVASFFYAIAAKTYIPKINTWAEKVTTFETR